MVEAGILEQVQCKPKNLVMLLCVPKGDPCNPRMILDFKAFTKDTKTPQFQLQNISKVTRTCSKSDFLLKFYLTNGFFHINLHKKPNLCLGSSVRINIMQLKNSHRDKVYPLTLCNELTALFKDLPVKFLIYLNDILLMGSKKILERAKLILLASAFLFNEEKCVLTPTRLIIYLGVIIDLDREVLSLTKKFVVKIRKELIKVKNYFLTKRYKWRLAGLINFAVPSLQLPTQVVNLAFHHHRKLYKYVNFIHCSWMSYKTYVVTLPVYSDATPAQISVVAPYENKLDLFTSQQNILENEYLGVFISHILRPYSPLITDNMAVMYLFRKGRFPLGVKIINSQKYS